MSSAKPVMDRRRRYSSPENSNRAFSSTVTVFVLTKKLSNSNKPFPSVMSPAMDASPVTVHGCPPSFSRRTLPSNVPANSITFVQAPAKRVVESGAGFTTEPPPHGRQQDAQGIPPRSNAVPPPSDITPVSGVSSAAPRTSAPPSMVNAGRFDSAAAVRSIGCVSVTLPTPRFTTRPPEGSLPVKVASADVFKMSWWRARERPVTSAPPQLKCVPSPIITASGTVPTAVFATTTEPVNVLFVP